MANTGMVLEIDKGNYTEADFMSKRFINAEFVTERISTFWAQKFLLNFLQIMA